MRILLVANTSWYFFNFRMDFLLRLREEGFEPVLVAPEDPFTVRLKEKGFTFVPLRMNRSSMNPVKELTALFQLYRIYREWKPALVHHFTVKCVLYGTIASSLSKVPATLNSVTGLGHLFLSNSIKVRFVRFWLLQLYRILARRGNIRFLFQNPDDQELFLRLKVVAKDTNAIVKGSGVDISRFQPSSSSAGGKPRLLFASRLLREKGIYELMEALRCLKKREVPFHFRCAGAIDQGNPSAVSTSDVEDWKREGLAEFLGHLDTIDQELQEADIVLLPSWREGLPKILLEASCAGKAILTTDVPGCREVVEHGRTGWLVPPRNAVALEEGLSALLKDPGLRHRLGAAAREKALREFDQNLIHQKTLGVYRELLNHA